MALKEARRPSPIKELRHLGQSLWLDNIRRQLITSGALARLRDSLGDKLVTRIEKLGNLEFSLV